eukprot:scaffold6247_cov416-Prasinococcus_capsulatus_cf.AAC.9
MRNRFRSQVDPADMPGTDTGPLSLEPTSERTTEQAGPGTYPNPDIPELCAVYTISDALFLRRHTRSS